jgi:hypothetical protein
MRQLSAADGLVTEVPRGAAAVVIVGPTDEFLEAEEDALIKYFDEGGSLFILLDPKGKAPERLLEHIGVEFDSAYAANTRTFLSARRGKPDRLFLVTKRTSSHPSVTGLARSGEPLALPYTGTVLKTEGTKNSVQFTVKSMAGTFKDLNGNFEMDRNDGEATGQYNFAAAVEAAQAPEGKERKGRAVVLGSTDVVADSWLRFRGNLTLASNVFNWLAAEEEVSVAVEEIPGEDVPIAHTAGAAKFWFFATIFLVPLGVLAFGLIYTRRQTA